MEKIALGEILQWTEGKLVGILEPCSQPAGISSDTRTIRKEDLFLALKGQCFDGHQFVEQAFQRGAMAAVVERSWGERNGKRAAGPLVLVDSPLTALGVIAGQYRRRFALPVVAVVGSSGKTTTKEMIAAVLGQRYKVLKSAGTENNEIGIPQTLLQLGGQHGAVVLELAARRVGDIGYLCSIANPNIGVLLNIGTAHLEFFESVEGVAKAKGELLDYLDESSMTLANFDDCVVAKEAKRTKGRLLGFSLERKSQFRGEGLVIDREGRGHFSLQNRLFDLQIPGRHNVYNALAAVAVGRTLKVSWEDIRSALNDFQPVTMRSETRRHGGIRIIDDSYNANPGSVRAALGLLRDTGAATNRKIAVLGDMLELGSPSKRLHSEIGCYLASLNIDILLAVGPLSAHVVDAARQEGMKPEVALHFSTKDKLETHLNSIIREGDVVLVKASRGMALEEIAGTLSC